MSESHSLPRIMIAGMSGDSGKTLVSLGLLLEARSRGLPVSAFKKGPDYIDAAWLGWAAGRPARNLDSYLMGFSESLTSFGSHALPEGLNVIEGNRGLYDGVDAAGTHSTAELAKSLGAPLLLVINAAKVTRTVAAFVLGCQKLDPGVDIAGVILNRVAGQRHASVLREAVEHAGGVPVLGVVPRSGSGTLLPERHLGLVTPAEHPQILGLEKNLRALVEGRLDLGRILTIARNTSALPLPARATLAATEFCGLKIGVLKDSAFNFYYPENLEALSGSGATLVQLSTATSSEVPHDLAALYIGGGFPETHGAAISSNRSFLSSLRRAAEAGLPIYAECGGLMLLSEAIVWRGSTYPMAGFFPFAVRMCDTPQGHGYTELLVDKPNPFYPVGLTLRGHEFHYSRVVLTRESPPTACTVRRGAGCYGGRDGITCANTWASYTHIHALGTPEWASGLLDGARRFALQKH